MVKEVYVGTDKQTIIDIIDANTNNNITDDNTRRIIDKYSSKYPIDGEVVTVQEKKVHVDYLPTIDAILKEDKEVVGAALYKVEKDQCLFLTDRNDPNLQDIYSIHRKKADNLADKLFKLNTEEFPVQWTHVHASILSGSFATVFNQTYGDWRESLSQ
jgi:hypothetical protein